MGETYLEGVRDGIQTAIAICEKAAHDNEESLGESAATMMATTLADNLRRTLTANYRRAGFPVEETG